MIENITLSAEADLIDAAREIARSEHKTLNAVFLRSGAGPRPLS